jgi:sec-independent protein translocase protein TatC
MSFLQRIFELREESDTPKPFLQHLEELRFMLIKMGLTLVACMMGSLFFRHELVRILQGPLQKVDPDLVAKLMTLGVADSMTISFHLAFYAGFVISFPLLLLFFAQFVVPALTLKEKKYVFPAIGIGFVLFLIGVALCYFYVLPETLRFFFQDAQSLAWNPSWTVRDYFSFVTKMLIAFGLAAELPVVVLSLVALGMVTFELLDRTRPYAIVAILVLAAIIAPTPDVITFLSLGIPMCLMYEACIWIAWVIDRRRIRRLEREMAVPIEEISNR